MKKQLTCAVLFFVLLFPYMAIWDLLKQAPLAAIGRAVQGYFQPKQQQATPTTSTQGFSSGFVNGSSGGGGGGGGGGSLVKNAQGQLVPSSSGGGGGGGNTGGGGGSTSELDKLLAIEREGQLNPIQLRELNAMRASQRPQAQVAPAAPITPPKFDMGAFSRKMQDMASNASQKFSAGLGAAGEAVKTGGSNLMSAIGRSVQPMPNFKVGAVDENAPATKKPASFTNPVEGTWFGGKGLFADRGWTEKLFGGKGSMEPTNLYNPKAAQVGQIGEKMGMTQTPLPATLPATPPALGGGEIGGQFNFANSPEVNQLIMEAITAPAAQIDVGEMQSLDTYVQQVSSELGIDKAQAAQQVVNEQVMQVGDAIEALDADVTKEGGDVLMTEGQRRRLIETRARPLREQLSKLVRSAQYLGVNMQNLMAMLGQRMEAKKATMTSQFQAAQMNQNAEEERKRRLMGLLPYVQPKAKAVSSGGGGTGEFSLESLLG